MSNILPLLYVTITTYTLLYKRKPWYYGYSDDNKNLKRPIIKFGLPFLYGIHTLTAVIVSIGLYKQFLQTTL